MVGDMKGWMEGCMSGKKTRETFNSLFDLVTGRGIIKVKGLLKKSWFHFEIGAPFLNLLNLIGLCLHGIKVSYMFADANGIAHAVS